MMLPLSRTSRNARALVLLAGLALPGAPLHAQDAPPAPVPAKLLDGPPTKLAFKNVTVEQIVPFIVEATGKVVLPQQDILSRKVTVLNDREVPRQQALDMVFVALAQNQIAVISHPDRILLRDVAEVIRGDVPVLGPEVSVRDRHDIGTIVEKVFTLKFVTAKKMGDAIKGALPEYAKMSVNEESNRIAVLGSVALAQRLETLVESMDRPPAGAMQTETFRLRYADAGSVAANIQDLFGETQKRQGDQNQNRFNWGRRNGGEGEEAGGAAGEIRVSSNVQQNAVTVAADPVVLGEIRDLVEKEWDLPLPEAAVIPKIYELKNSDPVKVKDLLEGLFGKASTTATSRPQGQQGQPGQQPQQGQPTSGQGAGRLAGQFTFQAIPEAGRLVVVARSPDNLAVIDKIIQGLDEPQTVGLPEIVELKHANAEDLAEQLNALLSQDGTLAAVRRSQSGLSTSSSQGSSPFAKTTTTTTATDSQNSDTSAQNITFWWQRSRVQTDQRTASNLVGKLRIVPVWRQNAVMVISPPEYRSSIVELISQLDKPGRQVLLAAIVAEMSRDDALGFGLRWGSSAITPTNADNAISLGTSSSGTQSGFAGSLFDSSVLNANVNVNFLLQALGQKTNVSILSEPKIFTSDNQEAEFFDGQDIPFVTDSQTNSQGNLVQSFDYKAVGIQLRVRPRITPKRDVDLRVNIQLSSILPGQTLFGGFVVDRRETTTQLIVGDRQTIVISGILRSEDSSITRKIPGLGDIPILGELFKSREKSKKTTELLVFVTPIVVTNDEESVDVNTPYRLELQNQRDVMQKKVGRDLKTELLAPSDAPGTSKPEPKPDEHPAPNN